MKDRLPVNKHARGHEEYFPGFLRRYRLYRGIGHFLL
jgi:hypothetical protein